MMVIRRSKTGGDDRIMDAELSIPIIAPRFSHLKPEQILAILANGSIFHTEAATYGKWNPLIESTDGTTAPA